MLGGLLLAGLAGCGPETPAVKDVDEQVQPDGSVDGMTAMDGGPTDVDEGETDGGGGGADADDGGDSCVPAEETCNGKDDDCDGEVDEELTRECPDQEGVCQGATVACTDGSFPNCGSDEYGADYESEETADHCDMVDNDCDGETDEKCGCKVGEEQQCGSGVGICTEGTQKCQSDTLMFGECTDADGSAVTKPGDVAETCNGQDDDCDGEVDEDTGGSNCTVGSAEGVCKAGTTACNNGMIECVADVMPSAETCDGKDNDCDGEVDEELGGASCTVSGEQGACANGTEACTNGSTTCQQTTMPQAEVCGDGVDNDCDGSTDESDASDAQTWYADSDGDGFGTMDTTKTACTKPTGYVAKPGDCDDADPAVNPMGTETCNGVDDNCDGTVDENLTKQCAKQQGVCAGSSVACTNGMFPSCGASDYGSDYVATETDMQCDGVDNDCDGTTDEKCSCQDGATQNCGTSTGVCQTGTQTCTNGSFGSCQGNVTGSSETCDGKDNDCDGSTDEDFSNKGTSCTVGTGVCQKTGSYVCKSDGSGTTCSVSPGTPQTEVCDGLDNDCDGQVDENLTKTCGESTGVCQTGTRSCSGGSYGSCQGNVTGSSETCDGKDNDCDGSTDEDFANKGSSCSVGTGACRNTGSYVCKADESGTTCSASAGSPSAEVCDGIDNDCDGQVDEQLTRSCGESTGVCSTGTETCSNGSWGSCQGNVGPSSESCDGKDNDCDGATDENFSNKGDTCYDGTGACRNSGSYVCKGNGSGTYCTASAGSPSSEVCDGVDNDCDGSTDEKLTKSCGTNTGVCQKGTRTCSSGSYGSCQGSIGPSAEVCDNRDNDCDGSVDEGYPTKGDSCSAGTGACYDSGTIVCTASGSGVTCNATAGSPSSETCNNIDDDCDGSVDEKVTRSCGKSTGQCTTGIESCSSGSWGSCSGTGPSSETCDGVDNDCDGSTDEGVKNTYYRDSDGDGYGTSSNTTKACSAPSGYVSTSGDCDDSASLVYPGALDRCNTVDEDCDGRITDGECGPECTCNSSGACENTSGDQTKFCIQPK